MRYLRDKKETRESQDRLYGLTRPAVPGEFADTLQDQVERLIDGGAPRDALYEDLKVLAMEFRQQGREGLEDEVLEVMDVLGGWCPPSARI